MHGYTAGRGRKGRSDLCRDAWARCLYEHDCTAFSILTLSFPSACIVIRTELATNCIAKSTDGRTERDGAARRRSSDSNSMTDPPTNRPASTRATTVSTMASLHPTWKGVLCTMTQRRYNTQDLQRKVLQPLECVFLDDGDVLRSNLAVLA